MTYLTIITSTNDDLCNYSCGRGLGLLCHGSAPPPISSYYKISKMFVNVLFSYNQLIYGIIIPVSKCLILILPV